MGALIDGVVEINVCESGVISQPVSSGDKLQHVYGI